MKSIAAKEHKDRKTVHCVMLMPEGAKISMRATLFSAESYSFYSLRSFAANLGLYADDLSLLL